MPGDAETTLKIEDLKRVYQRGKEVSTLDAFEAGRDIRRRLGLGNGQSAKPAAAWRCLDTRAVASGGAYLGQATING